MQPFLRMPGILLIAILLIFSGCDQQQPIAAKPPPTPGAKEGETPPVEPDQGPQRHRDGSIPLPPATAPTTPGVPNHPSAPQLPPTPATPSPTQTPPPTSSPTEAPSLVPQPRDGTSLQPSDTTPAVAHSGRPVNDVTRRDSTITSAVYRALSSQPGLSHEGALVTISTLDGEVTLRGSVATDAERDQLAVVAGHVAGVRSVNNQLDLIGP